MRKSEITPELIELSRRAKSLGFPQDVKKGDWVTSRERWKNQYAHGVIVNVYLAEYRWRLIKPNESLILEFSQCLKWLRERGWYFHNGYNYHIEGFRMDWVYIKEGESSESHEVYSGNIHVCGAKAVVKILEGEG